MPTETDVVRAWHRALNSGNLEALLDLSYPDIEIAGPRGSARGHAALREWATQAGVTLEMGELFAGPGVVVAAQRGVWQPQGDGEAPGRAEVATVFRVEGGRVRALARSGSLDEALEVAGLSRTDSVPG